MQMSPEEILAIQQREFAGKYAAATKDFEADRERLTGQYREALVHSQESIAKRDEALKEMSMSQEQFNEQLTCAKSSNALLEEKLVNETSAWERERFELRDSIKEFRRGSEMVTNHPNSPHSSALAKCVLAALPHLLIVSCPPPPPICMVVSVSCSSALHSNSQLCSRRLNARIVHTSI